MSFLFFLALFKNAIEGSLPSPKIELFLKLNICDISFSRNGNVGFNEMSDYFSKKPPFDT